MSFARFSLAPSTRALRLLIFVLAVCGVQGADLVLYPNADVDGNTIGNRSSFAPGFPFGSWQANATVPGTKSETYIQASTLFPGGVKISDIASVSYWTNKPGLSTDPDWSFYFYTVKQPGDSSFYHSRLTSEPYLTNTPVANDPPNQWHKWSTNDPNNPMRFYDSNRDGGIFGTFTDPTLAQIQAGPITWPASGTTVDYRNEQINFFSIQTGSAWASTFRGLLDGLTITLKDGTVARVNFEALALQGELQVNYTSNLTLGDSSVNITNTGVNGASLNGPGGFGSAAGNMCVNAYVFSPDEQLISCCSCLITPNGLASLSVNSDLVSNTLTGVRPDSVVIKLVATGTGSDFAGTSCSNSAAVAGNVNFPLASGMLAWGTTVRPGPGLGLSLTEKAFSIGTLSADELSSITNRCTAIMGNGSSFGICRSCRAFGLGAIKQ